MSRAPHDWQDGRVRREQRGRYLDECAWAREGEPWSRTVMAGLSLAVFVLALIVAL